MKTDRATRTRRSPFEAQVTFARATTALGGMGFGALAVGATAVGAVAIGAMAIRKLATNGDRIERLDTGELDVGRLPNAAHESRPWRIHEIAPDFELEDVWALPTPGGPDDFPRLVRQSSGDPDFSGAAGVLWRLRDRLGGWFGLGRISVPGDGGGDDAPGKLPIPGTEETSLTDRLPDDLRGTAADVRFGSVPFVPLYRADNEFAAEMSNRTVHSIMHLGWVPDGRGGHRGQMAVLVKPNGLLGKAYMVAIKPFRYLIVYPALMRMVGREWRAGAGGPIESGGPG